MTLRLTILGCGSSGGVPRIGNEWGECDPGNPKNRRRRCSVLVEKIEEAGSVRVLVDTSPDLREQLLSADVDVVDAVVYTHEHADHAHGIDDLRVVAFNAKRQIDVHMADDCWQKVGSRFSYCFETPEGSGYPPILTRHEVRPFQSFSVANEEKTEILDILPLEQVHGNIMSLGYRFGNIAYSTDLNDMPDETVEQLHGLDVWVLDALRFKEHPTHFNVDQALKWIEKLAPKRAVLTNLHVDLDYEALNAYLPDNVEPAYDSLVLESVTS